MKPTVNIKAKNPTYAIYAHVLALIGGLISVIFGIIGLLGNDFLGGILSLIIAIIVVIVELDTIEIAPLKDALVRGIVWIIIAVMV